MTPDSVPESFAPLLPIHVFGRSKSPRILFVRYLAKSHETRAPKSHEAGWKSQIPLSPRSHAKKMAAGMRTAMERTICAIVPKEEKPVATKRETKMNCAIVNG